MVSEMKLGSSSTNTQFVIEGYASAFGYDKNCYVSRILLSIAATQDGFIARNEK